MCLNSLRHGPLNEQTCVAERASNASSAKLMGENYEWTSERTSKSSFTSTFPLKTVWDWGPEWQDDGVETSKQTMLWSYWAVWASGRANWSRHTSRSFFLFSYFFFLTHLRHISLSNMLSIFCPCTQKTVSVWTVKIYLHSFNDWTIDWMMESIISATTVLILPLVPHLFLGKWEKKSLKCPIKLAMSKSWTISYGKRPRNWTSFRGSYPAHSWQWFRNEFPRLKLLIHFSWYYCLMCMDNQKKLIAQYL